MQAACLVERGLGFAQFVGQCAPDILCLQEIKAHPDQVEEMAWSEGYHGYWNPADRKGYSGTAVFALPSLFGSCVSKRKRRVRCPDQGRRKARRQRSLPSSRSSPNTPVDCPAT